MRYAMMIDLEECVGCQACVSSCKEQWDSGPGAARSWVRSIESGTRGEDLAMTFYPGLCMQCDSHPCTNDCPTGATFMNENGVIVVNPDLCIGCGSCVSNCPYGARRVDPVKGIVEKCNLCAPLVARGEKPACVATCLAECRVFGDIDNPSTEISQAIRARDARPLTTLEVNTQPKVAYAGARQRKQILGANEIVMPRASALTNTWTGLTRPFAQYFVPLAPVAAIGGGIVANFIERRNRVALHEAKAHEQSAPEVSEGDEIRRHRLGMRVLHWFNAFSWLLLIFSGTALMATKHFALFGMGFPAAVSSWLGGADNVLRLHVVWGLLWAGVIVPFFLLFKQGGREAIEEIRLGRDDLVWLARKPFELLHLTHEPLPPQEKYNAGQKIFAITAILGTATIIATGLVMTLHIGSATTISIAILLHKLAIAFAIIGLSVHLTMAAVIRAERPALRSMITGKIDRSHAERHNRLWLEQYEGDDEDYQ